MTATMLLAQVMSYSATAKTSKENAELTLKALYDLLEKPNVPKRMIRRAIKIQERFLNSQNQ